ncbi:MAG TPA: STAS domain-containing protein [Spirochaetota bacterium]|nr:STAS domain-containing protein [Spirochaetota bacterium]HPC41714.1 STAS domain-containing protein [Spirochaetota bacterium]HPL15636.1 STAS domain-containing protein [Spirochaetota bacterium]HQF09261.1 STAS domain-containing protein [Spirochaetota bacterium]HQH98209.1 STAS domain-containing protein [Spirochaetota bacterium]
MEVNYRDLGDHKIISLKGEMDYFSSKDIRDEIFKYIHTKTKSIILDLKDVSFIDSAGMGLLINLNREMSNNNGTLGLLNLSEDVFSLIKLATLDTIIPIYTSEEDID